MKLSFYARREHRCKARPGHVGSGGSPNLYVGVEWDDEKQCAVASREPFVVDTDKSQASKELADNLLRKMRSKNGRKDPPLLPADDITARACGLEPVKCALRDGWWEPVAKTASKPAPASTPVKADG